MPVSAMKPAALASARGRSPSSAASRSASASVSPAMRCCSSATDSARASTSTSTGAAISAQPGSREVISTCPLPPGSHAVTSAGVSALSNTSSHRPRSRSSASTAARTTPVPGSGLDASQREPERGDLVADQPGLLGVDPPGQVVGPGEPVRVLGGQLGLAHPAHAVQRLHHRRVPAQQPVPHRLQQAVPAGEPRITGRDVPHPRHSPGQPRHGRQYLGGRGARGPPRRTRSARARPGPGRRPAAQRCPCGPWGGCPAPGH